MPLRVDEKFGPDTASNDSLTNGTSKKRKFWVNTRDDMAAVFAVGVPRIGDSLGSAFPNLIATEISARPLGGADNASGLNGVSEVVVTYGVDNRQISVLPAGTKHTVIAINNESVEVGAAVTDAGTPVVNEVFNNKKPASKLVGRITAEIHDYRANSYNVPFVTLIGLATDKAMNSDAVVLPAPIGLPSSGTINLAPKQALYMGFRVEATPSGTILIVHELQLAIDFNLRWAVPDINGKILRVESSQLYRTQPFTGLW